MSHPYLLSTLGTGQLLSMYGEHSYSNIWTLNQAWIAANRQESAQLRGVVRQALLAIHKDLYPDDSTWINTDERRSANESVCTQSLRPSMGND